MIYRTANPSPYCTLKMHSTGREVKGVRSADLTVQRCGPRTCDTSPVLHTVLMRNIDPIAILHHCLRLPRTYAVQYDHTNLDCIHARILPSLITSHPLLHYS